MASRLIGTALCLLTLNACQTADQNPVTAYLRLAPANADAGSKPRIQAFVKLFSQFSSLWTPEKIAGVYAERLYFNDTLITLYDRQALQKYLQHTQHALDFMSFEVLDTYEHNNDVLIRWRMRTRFTVLGQVRDVESVGASHLRFNNDGKIILHQDFWDSMQGFYLHVPVIGGVLQWLKNGLQDS